MQHLIEQASRYLQGKIRHTPVEYSPKLSQVAGHPVYLKLECLQLTGSFKVRGGIFYLSTLGDAERKRGVAVCSAGNHGLGVAYAGREFHIPCTVFVPKNIDQAKYDKLIDLGARVRKSEFTGYDDTLKWAVGEAQSLQIPFISAFDDEKIMCANGGTLSVEVLAQVPEAVHFVLPMGGGGLAAGFAWHAKAMNPQAKITICQLAECPTFQLSLHQGQPVTYMPAINTLAGGLEGGLGAKCFEILKTHVDAIALIKESELKEALCWFLQNHHYLIEPSASVALASCLHGHLKITGPTVIVLTGRNVCYMSLQRLLQVSVQSPY